MKQKHFITLDTETTGLPPRNYVYDIGYTIATRKTVAVERSFLVREIITAPRFMLSALNNDDWRSAFGGKIFTHYIPELNRSNIHLHSWRDIVGTMREDMRTFGVDVFAAYNLKFDMGAIMKTNETVHGKGAQKVLEYKPDLLDLWTFACDTALNSRLYHEFARMHGFISDAGNVRTTAEKTYAFLTGNPGFVESHTALHDAQIETEILQRLLARKKTIPYNHIPHMPWKIAQKIVDPRRLI